MTGADLEDFLRMGGKKRSGVRKPPLSSCTRGKELGGDKGLTVKGMGRGTSTRRAYMRGASPPQELVFFPLEGAKKEEKQEEGGAERASFEGLEKQAVGLIRAGRKDVVPIGRLFVRWRYNPFHTSGATEKGPIVEGERGVRNPSRHGGVQILDSMHSGSYSKRATRETNSKMMSSSPS